MAFVHHPVCFQPPGRRGANIEHQTLAVAQPLMTQAEQAFQIRLEKQRHFGEIQYAAATWDHERQVIVKADHTASRQVAVWR